MIGYVHDDYEKEIIPLIWCLGFCINGGKDLEYYLRGIIGKDQLEPVGGDPGWNLVPELQEDGRYLYFAWVLEDMGIEPNEGVYEENIVKFHIRNGLENVLKEQPSRQKEIDEIFLKYDL